MRSLRDRATDTPTAYMPDGTPAPFVLTEAELVRFLRLDEAGTSHPDKTLQRWRTQGLLRATQIGNNYRYELGEAIEFVHRLHLLQRGLSEGGEE